MLRTLGILFVASASDSVCTDGMPGVSYPARTKGGNLGGLEEGLHKGHAGISG